MILVVDDEKIVQTVTCKALELMGFSCCTADNGEESLRVYQEHAAEIELVVMDFSMPEMNGLEALIQLRALNPKLPIVICSGQCEEETKALCVEKEANAFIKKPFHMKDLADTVSAVLGEKAPIA